MHQQRLQVVVSYRPHQLNAADRLIPDDRADRGPHRPGRRHVTSKPSPNQSRPGRHARQHDTFDHHVTADVSVTAHALTPDQPAGHRRTRVLAYPGAGYAPGISVRPSFMS
jgi:hypothetical protein